MTEEEAKAKWCPMARTGEQACGAAENRPDGSLTCLASACMMWRWRTTPGQAADRRAAGKNTAEDGYCGLAGATQ